MSVPVTIDLPSTYRRVDWAGRLGPVAAVVGEPPEPAGSVLMLPGLTGSKEDYFAILGPLHERGWSVAVVDLPGMYESAGSQAASDYTLPLFADDIRRMLGQLPKAGDVHLVGHSAGGLLARHTAVADPGRVTSLTLYDSGSGSVSPSARESTETLLYALQEHSTLEVHLMKRAIDDAAGRPRPAPQIEEFLVRRWTGTTAAHLIGLAEITLTAPDLLEDLAVLADQGRLPLLALYGEDDRTSWTQAGFEALAAAATAAAVIPDAEHSPAVENPAAMVAALDRFWRSLR